MNPEELQQNNPQVNPDKAAAALALATRISEGLMPKQDMAMEGQELPQEGPMMPEATQMAQEPENTRLDDLEAKMDAGFEELKGMMKKDDDSEVSKLREELRSILDESEETENE